jgi:translocation and assembly module TamA
MERSRQTLALSAMCALALFAAPARADHYRVVFEGAPNGLESELRLASTLARAEWPAPTVAALDVLARRDLEDLQTAMQAAGYYAAKIAYTIRTEDKETPTVAFDIEPGPLFRIEEYVIRYVDEAPGRPDSFDDVDIAPEGEADGKTLQTQQQLFLDALWNRGYPAARMVGRRAVADLDAGTARAEFVFASGPRAHFGEIRVNGAKETAPRFIEKLAVFEKGELYERKQLVEYRDRLVETGLFSSVDVAPGAPEPDGTAPVIVTVEERKRRTIGVGASYSTAEGPGARLFFEYRNLFHNGERARVELKGSRIEQAVLFNVEKPLPAFPGSAFAQLDFRNELTEAFDARSVRIGGGLTRLWLEDRLETKGGIALETSKVRSETTEERNYFVSFPLSTTWNTEEDLLDPKKGVRTTFALTPYTGSLSFTTAELNARSRLYFGDGRFAVAFRGRLGSTFGAAFDDLPLNKRFYAGGGASVRGYEFQTAGPLDIDGNPTGGRSVIEGAVEGRVKVAEKFQAAAFLDVGSVSPSVLPDFGAEFFPGAGAGVRYLTPIGPIRLDIATPLKKRESDRAFQLYISLGQPF